MIVTELETTAEKMVAKGKGILAIDESTPTIKKRFDTINVESTEENRRAYRDLLITNPNSNEYISGMILYDETIRQSTKEGVPFAKKLIADGIMPGIKVDTGAKSLAKFNNEKVTEGLDGLRDRLIEYYDLGARFAKWRAVITIGDNIPSDACIYANAHALARYAALCQESNIVPIVEPEVLMDGNHTIEMCYEVTQRSLNIVFEQLMLNQVMIEGIVLKPNMVISGKDCNVQANVEKVADMTFKCLLENVPSEVPGIAFLSGGQSSDDATAHLSKMNEKYSNEMPWNLTFSYGRALQHDSLNAWSGSNRELGQNALIKRAKSNSFATYGKELTVS